MLFGKRKRIVKRVLIIEDEPLTAFDNETMLVEAGFVAPLHWTDERGWFAVFWAAARS